MSRIYYDDDSDNPYLDQGRWEHNSKLALSGKRGQKALRELEAALLALSTKRLIDDNFASVQMLGAGPVAYEGADVCVLGAYALHRGYGLAELEGLNADLYGSANETARWAKDALGLTFTLAWNLVELNDEAFAGYTPEQRYAHILGWVRENIRMETL